jgi:hypothetical protein
MSIPDRIARLGKAYYGAIKDRIDTELSSAEAAQNELDGGANSAAATLAAQARSRAVPPPPKSELPEIESLLRRVEEKIAANKTSVDAMRELNPNTNLNPNSNSNLNATPVLSDHPLATEYYVLGVAAGSDFMAVQAAYTDLSRRSDPNRFPAGSTERERATKIAERIERAYKTLQASLVEGGTAIPTTDADATRSRFDRIEL